MMEPLRQTPSQTVGPFFAYSLAAVQYGYDFNSIVNGSLLHDDAEGERIYITGQIFDGEGNVVPDALIEFWQADAAGNYITQYPDVPTAEIPFKGFGRLGTGTAAQHSFTFTTIKPGAVNGNAPNINVIVFMRGSLHALFTRIYFSDEANDKDPLLNAVDAERKQTLIAAKKMAVGRIHYQFDIHVQGERETVFFDL